MLLKDLAGEQVLAAPEFETEIAGLSADSRTVSDGFLFAALKGATSDGTRFIEDARAAQVEGGKRHQQALGNEFLRIRRRFDGAEAGPHQNGLARQAAEHKLVVHDRRKAQGVPSGAQGIHQRTGIDLVADRPETGDNGTLGKAERIDMRNQRETAFDACVRIKRGAPGKGCRANRGLARRHVLARPIAAAGVCREGCTRLSCAGCCRQLHARSTFSCRPMPADI